MNNTVVKPEILAPAGSAEQMVAAVRCGADAVYLGVGKHNARVGASNFDRDSLPHAVSYCHSRNVKVYVAMNTLVTDREFNDVKDEIRLIADCGADGVIVQDLAVAAMWRQFCPQMKLSASTQMTIHNIQGALEAESMGFNRIVLARELTLEEIKTIILSVNAEIEVFVHGALCMSVSGTCLLSSMLGGRSGNRGRCAQPCRLNFTCGERKYALSLKDLSLMEHVKALSDAGVASFKIEGRMKRPEYAAATVTALRKALDGENPDTETLKAVFSRSGFTDGYFTGNRDLSMFGNRRLEDVTASQSVMKKLKGLYKDEICKIPVTMNFKANSKESSLTVSDGIHSVSVQGNVPQKAVNKSLDSEYAEKLLDKTGGTYFYTESIDCDISRNISLSASSINALRRMSLEKLYEKRSEPEPKEFIDGDIPHTDILVKGTETKIRVRFEKIDQIFDDVDIDKIILPLGEILRHKDCVRGIGDKLICELPSLVFPEDEKNFADRLIKLQTTGVKEVIADNIGVLKIAAKYGFILHGGHGLNVLNSLSFESYLLLGMKDITLSPEMNMKLVTGISSANGEKGLVGYGFLPLMRFRTCPAQSKDGCGNCKGNAEIKDRYGISFRVICSAGKYSSLLNSVPLYIGDKDYSAADFSVLYFTFDSPE